MNIKKLITDDEAVSPVIGVILMVAITVILAAVIGTFVLGLGDQVQDTAPQASFNFDFGTSDVTVTHDGGDSIDISGASVNLASTDGGSSAWTETDDEISAGDSTTEPYTSGATIRVVWTSANGDNSATLGKAEAP